MKIPWYLMANGKGGGGYKTAYGHIVSISDALAAPLRSLLVNIDPVQKGTGDPSPDNVRPISGWTEANVWVKPTYDPTANPTAALQLGQTVYGGTIDVTKGVLTVDMAIVDLGTANWTATGATGRTRIDSVVSAMTAFSGKIPAYKSNFLCSNYKNGGLQDYTYTTNGEVYYTNGTPSTPGNNLIRINDIGMANMSASEVKAYLSGAQLVYELATPITIPLTPQEISTLQGQNNVWADSGDVTVEYLSAGGANPDLMKLAVAFMKEG